jgi:hypothetical protein
MLHQIEYRIYWIFWGIIPLMLATTVFMIPAFQKAPEVKIVVTDSLPDYLFRANEAIAISFKTEALQRAHLQVTWTFGAPVYVWQPLPANASHKRLDARLDWGAGAENPLGLKLDVKYDSLDPLTEYAWQNVVAVTDSVVKVKFPEPGRYRLKLMLQDTLHHQAYVEEAQVEIVPATVHFPNDTLVKIVGPTKGLVGEELIFSSTGSTVNFWYWKFGDGKNQDANQPQVVYSFNQKGKYIVTLKTDNPDSTFSHEVEIFPTWNADSVELEVPDTINIIPIYQLDLKRRLQEIANTTTAESERFYTLKKAIQRDYLSDRWGAVNVWINKEKEPVDFDSYCQRIHFLEGKTVIEKVTFEWDGDSTGHRIRELWVQQKKMNE